MRARAREIERANSKLEHQLHRAPTDEELADELEMTVEEFQEALLQVSNSTIAALDELWGFGDSSRRLRSRCSTRSRTTTRPTPRRSSTRARCATASPAPSSACPSARSSSIALYYYENLTLREIGEVLGVTESRVSQLHTKAVLRLRSGLNEAE